MLLLLETKPSIKRTHSHQLRRAEEHQSIIDAKVWDVHEKQDLPPRRKLVGSRWVYKVKFNADSSGERYKARLVAQGFSQQPGIDYDETFAPVTRYDSLRLIIAMAAILQLQLW